MRRAGVSIVAAAFWFVIVAADCGEDAPVDDHSHGAHGGSAGPAPVPCPASTPVLKMGLEATGKDGKVTARIVDADFYPPRKGTNDWTVTFVDGAGMPLEDITVSKAEPFMPVHNHDGRYPPTTIPLEEPGTFEFESINMHMGGPWEMRFTVESKSAGNDYIVFNVCVED